MSNNAPPPVVSNAKRQAAVPFILVTVFLDILGIGIIAPVLPVLIGDFVTTKADQAFWSGVMVITYGVMQFLCAPLLGALSDKYGRRPVLLIAVVGLGLDFLLMALSTNIYMLLIARFIGGLTAANIAVANAYIADVTPPQDRAAKMGLIGAAFGIGFMIGPLLGGVLGNINHHLPFYVAAGLAFGNALYGYFVVPESLPADKRNPRLSWARANPIGGFAALHKLRGVMPLVWAMLLLSLAQMILQTSWNLYTIFRFNWTPRDVGISLFVVGLMAAVTQGVLIKPLIKTFGEQRLVVLALLSCAVAYFLYGTLQVGWWLYIVIACNFVGFAAWPTLQSLISRSVDPKEQGATMGTLSALQSLAVVVAPLIGTPLLTYASHLPPQDWRFGTLFYVCTGFTLVALVIVLVHLPKQKAHPAQDPKHDKTQDPEQPAVQTAAPPLNHP